MAFTDNFNRANANLESSPTSSGGGDWTHDGLIVGALAISSNALRCATTNATGSAYKSVNQGTSDHYAQYKVAVLGSSGAFVCCRLADRSNFVGVRNDGSVIEVYRRVSGTLTGLYTSGSGAVALNDVLRLECNGTNWALKKNGSPVTNGAIGAAGLTSSDTGVVARTVTATFADDVEFGPLAAGISVNVTGNSATVSVGSVSVTAGGAISVGLTGSSIAVSAGTVSATTTITPPFSDNFNRSNADLEDSPVASGGGNWSHDGLVDGAFTISSNVLNCATTDGTGSTYKTPELGSSDQFVEFSVPSISTILGPFACCRLTDRNNFVGIRAGAGTPGNFGFLQAYRRVAGTFTVLFNGTDDTVANNDVVKLATVGSNYYVFRNGRLLDSAAINDGGVLTSDDTGLVARLTPGAFFENFRAGKQTIAAPTGLSATVSVGTVTVETPLPASIFVGLTEGVAEGVIGGGGTGSLPTGWEALSGFITMEVVRIGSDDEVECFDLKLSALYDIGVWECRIFFPAGETGVAASQGEYWRAAAYNKLIAEEGGGIGPDTGLRVWGNGPTGEGFHEFENADPPATSGAYQLSYRETSGEFSEADVAYAVGQLSFSVDASEGPSSATFRIAARLDELPIISVAGQSVTVSVGTVSVATPAIGPFADNFNRANANLESSPISSSGGAWTHDGEITGAFQISSNTLRGNTTDTNGSAYTALNSGSTNHFVEFRNLAVSIEMGPFACCRMLNRSNFVGIRAGADGINHGKLQVFRRVGGVLNVLYDSIDGMAGIDDVFRLTCNDDDFYVFKNSVFLTSGPILATLTSPKIGAVARFSVGTFFDNFQAGKQTIAAVTGQPVTVSVGNVTVVGKASTTVTGNQVAVSLGNETIRHQTGVAVTGNQVAASVGNVTSRQGATTSLIGEQLTVNLGEIGTYIVSYVSVTGQEIAVEVGNTEAAVVLNVLVDGLELQTYAGNITDFILDYIFEIEGVSVTASVGPIYTTNWGTPPDRNPDRWTPIAVGSPESWGEVSPFVAQEQEHWTKVDRN